MCLFSVLIPRTLAPDTGLCLLTSVSSGLSPVPGGVATIHGSCLSPNVNVQVSLEQCTLRDLGWSEWSGEHGIKEPGAQSSVKAPSSPPSCLRGSVGSSIVSLRRWALANTV